MNKAPIIRFAPKNEGLTYTDVSGVYLFDIGREKNKWRVFLPFTKLTDNGEVTEALGLSEDDKSTILENVRSFLEAAKWRGIWKKKCAVEFINQN